MNTKRILGALSLALLLVAGCAKNPLSPSSGPLSNGTTYYGLVESRVRGLFYSPLNAATFNTVNPNTLLNNGGIVRYSYGGVSAVREGPYPGTLIYGGTLGRQNTNLLLISVDGEGLRGIGGLDGQFGNDYFVRYEGLKGNDSSKDYSSISFYLTGPSGPGVDLSQYRGFVFFARGTGSFAVNLIAGSTSTGQAGPYLGYNYYLKMFGSELNGREQWKQVTVNFRDMVQTFGVATDKPSVLKGVFGLQFDQQPPLSADFRLDIDYIRFF